MDAARAELRTVLLDGRSLIALPDNHFDCSSWQDAEVALRERDGLLAALEHERGLLPKKLVHLKWESLIDCTREGPMKKRRTADEVTRLLRDVERDLANGLTIADGYRKIGIAETTYYRWRQRHDPAQVDADRRCRELEAEVERLKRLVAELMLDKQMLQDLAKKSGEPGAAACRGGLPGGALRHLTAPELRRDGAVALDRPIPLPAPGGRAGVDPRDQAVGPVSSTLRLSSDPCDASPPGLVVEHQAGASALGRTRPETASTVEKTSETRPETGHEREQLRPATGVVQKRRVDV
jgi:putative transposase